MPLQNAAELLFLAAAAAAAAAARSASLKGLARRQAGRHHRPGVGEPLPSLAADISDLRGGSLPPPRFLPSFSWGGSVCMHYLSPKMVCETKIVAEDHESMSGAKKETIIVSSSQMWPSLAGGAAPSSAPAAAAAAGDGDTSEGVRIREFHPSEQDVVRRIFYEGIMERIPNTAFRGLKDQPVTQLVYGTMAVICFVVTKSLLLTCCLPIFLMGMRYYFSRKVILSYLECALNTDMSDIEQYYMKSPEIIRTEENVAEAAAVIMALHIHTLWTLCHRHNMDLTAVCVSRMVGKYEAFPLHTTSTHQL